MSLELVAAIAEKERPDIQRAVQEVIVAGLLPEGNYVTSNQNHRALLVSKEEEVNGDILTFEIIGNGDVKLLDKKRKYKELPLTTGIGPKDAYDITYTAVHIKGTSAHPRVGILHEAKPYY